MGHTRLGNIPKTKKWTAVVSSIAGDSDSSSTFNVTISQKIDSIAAQTLDAAQGGLSSAINDLGLRYTFFLLTQIALAARSNDWKARLNELGLQVSDQSGLSDLTTEMQSSIDEYLFAHNHSSDVSEMAQKAAGEAVSVLSGPKSSSLFGDDLDQVKVAVRDFSTKRGFSSLGQKFFGLFMAQFLNFYLSRVTASHVNGQNIQQLGEITTFNESLRIHCEQSARVVYDFCGEWYSKTEHLTGIDLDNTSGFIAVAVKKLQAELKQQERSI